MKLCSPALLCLAVAGTAAQNATNITIDVVGGTVAQNATDITTDVVDSTAAQNATNITTDLVDGTAAQNATNITTDVVDRTDDNVVKHENCGADVYYSSLSGDSTTWSMEEVRDLIAKTHLTQLKTTAKTETIFHALADLDPGTPDSNGKSTVLMYMREKSHRADQVNLNEGWKRGDMWPLSRGAGLTTKAATDVHCKKPADWTVDEFLREFFWGTCGNHENIDKCVTPAVPEETAATTSTDGKIKTPPEELRGDVARAVFYQALRYSEDLGLKLTDCPPFANNEYAYLSELLQWHIDDPVSIDEISRNDRACSRWQGNRNPFVDYQNLVEQFYGTPDEIVEGTYKYSKCVEATQAPTATPNECSSIRPGDIQIIIFNSDPVDELVLFPVQPIPEAVGSIFITDKAWNGTDFVTEEGVLEYSIPEGGISAGSIFAYGKNFPNDMGTWEKSELFDLQSTSPDNILVYCINADDEPHFISSLTYNDDGFSEPGLETYKFSETSNPAETAGDGSLALPFAPSYLYEGPRTGNRVELVAAFKDPKNYRGSNTAYDIVTSGVGQIPVMVSTVLALVAAVALLA